VLIDHRHRPWAVATLLVAVAAGAFYAVWAWERSPGRLPGGGSVPGILCGALGGLIILFEFLLWPRKHFRTWRIGRAVTWMRAHIWLGLLTVPLLVLHSGFSFGQSLSTWLSVLFLIVIASGVWGLILQNWLPKVLLDDVQAETVYAQIDHVIDQLRGEADRLVFATCGPSDDPAANAKLAPGGESDDASPHYLTIGAVRSAGRVQGKVLAAFVPTRVEGAGAVRAFYASTAEPFLHPDIDNGHALFDRRRAAAMFGDLHTRVPPEAQPAVELLQDVCEQRRQLRLQSRIQFWLHNWLWVHLPLSVALVILMVIHIYYTLKYS
jgi:hypothetical protein